MQVNILIYAMGDDTDDILHSFRLSVADSKNYDDGQGQVRAALCEKTKRDLRESQV